MHATWLDRDDAARRRADMAACRVALRQGSRTFSTAALLLPRSLRDPACALYAFCRVADDEIDLGGGAAEAVDRLRDRLDRAYAGRPLDIVADRAFAAMVAHFAMPRALPEALIEGFAWDAAGRRYETLAELQAYAARVAGTVGAMMSVLMGRRAPEVVARACDLGVAMQLTNIARDVGEDACAGRLYLPLDWLRAEGIDPERFLAAPSYSHALGRTVRRLLGAADALYARSGAGIAALPAGCRPAIQAARHLYAEIGRQVERQGLDSVSRRAVVPAGRMLRLLPRIASSALSAQSGLHVPALDETRFLVAAVAAAPAPPAGADIRWWDLAGRAAWVIELFERLERREREARGTA
ncbi:MAG: phytoene/squalene synthase family protein [Alphaproteobacteria bacterium]|nr:phytoene/squalene synthase family protein [Alphaproteobacteria bacterium]